MSETKEQRLESANQFIEFIAGRGRKFFSYHDRVARLELSPTKRVFIIDEYTGKRVYTHMSDCEWVGFNNGGTLKLFIQALRDYITKGHKLRAEYFQPPLVEGRGHVWGYPDEDMGDICITAVRLGIAKFGCDKRQK